MIEHGFARTSVITRLRRGPLGSHLDALAATLHQQGYTPDSIRRILRAGDTFGQWLSQHGHAIADVDDALVARYLRTLPPPAIGRWPKTAAGLSRLLRFWRQQDLLPPPIGLPSRTEATVRADSTQITVDSTLVTVDGLIRE